VGFSERKWAADALIGCELFAYEGCSMKTITFVLVLWIAPWNLGLAGAPNAELAKKQRKSKRPGKPRKPANFT